MTSLVGMDMDDVWRATLEDALARLKVHDPDIVGTIVGNHIDFKTKLTADEASAILMDCIHPLRPPVGCRFQWEEFKDGPA